MVPENLAYFRKNFMSTFWHIHINLIKINLQTNTLLRVTNYYPLLPPFPRPFLTLAYQYHIFVCKLKSWNILFEMGAKVISSPNVQLFFPILFEPAFDIKFTYGNHFCCTVVQNKYISIFGKMCLIFYMIPLHLLRKFNLHSYLSKVA